MSEIIIFPTKARATPAEIEGLRLLELEVAIRQFDAAADEAARLVRQCLDLNGKWAHGEVAAYFRRHANVAREELANLEAESGWATRSG